MKRTTFVVTVSHELDERDVLALRFDLQVKCERDGVGMVQVTDLEPGLSHDDACRLLAREILDTETT